MNAWGAYRSRGVTSFAGVMFGLLGAAASAALWLHEVSPGNPLTRYVTQNMLSASNGWGALVAVATVAGGLALLMALLGTIGSRSGVLIGFALSVIALSYPFAYLAQIVARPFTGHGPFH